MNNSQNAEGLLLAALVAARGDIVVAPNYAGYDTSTLAYHPFLVADQQSKDMIDALTAARSALPTLDAPLTTDSGQLFITGYSQGGFVVMPTHRATPAAGMTVTASAPMSGPYTLAAFVEAEFYGEVSSDAPVVATPPDPAYADITPATTPVDLAPIFAMGFGFGNLIQNSFRLSYLQDAQANPDGGFPTVISNVAPVSPGLALRKALTQNDLRIWTPTAPTLLCGGDQDPTVFWINTQLMQDYLTTHAHSSSAVANAYHSTLVPPFCLAAVLSFFAAQ